MSHSLASMAVVMAAVASSGCGRVDLADICASRESCRGGNDRDKTACLSAAEAERTVADDLGCSDEFESSVGCVASHSVCRVRDGGPCNTNDDCAAQTGGVCRDATCRISEFGMAAEDTSCDAAKSAYARCTK